MENILMASTSVHKIPLGTNDKLQIRIFKEKEEEIHIKHTSK
jgi:hypothetical protein